MTRKRDKNREIEREYRGNIVIFRQVMRGVIDTARKECVRPRGVISEVAQFDEEENIKSWRQ